MLSWLSSTLILIVVGGGLGLACFPLRNKTVIAIVASITVILVGLGYWHWGGWQAQSAVGQQIERQQRAEKAMSSFKSPQVLIATLVKHLEAHPDSARGWFLLGRLYASQHLWEKSYQAFAKAYALHPGDEGIAVNFAQSLLSRNHPQDADRARDILKTTLATHPQQADALLILAMEAQHRQASAEALIYWRRLLILVPESSPEAASIRKAIHDLDRCTNQSSK